jgi:type IV secretion system protein VirB9
MIKSRLLFKSSKEALNPGPTRAWLQVLVGPRVLESICCLGLALSLTFPIDLQAQERDAPMGADPRLLQLEFDAQQSYLILTRPKSVTLIQMQAEETIVTAVAGDTVNFSVVVSQSRNYVMVRPKYEGLTTSLTLITNLRNYPLTLRSTKEALGKWYQRVQWSYPKDLNEEQADLLHLQTRERVLSGSIERESLTDSSSNRTNKKLESLEQSKVMRELSSGSSPKERSTKETPLWTESEMSPFNNQSQPAASIFVDLSHLNMRYTIQGDTPFRPLLVFDDGVRTYFKMPHAMQSMPALFVLEDGASQLVNYIVRQEHMVAQGLHSAYVLKLADKEVKVITTPDETSGFWGRFKP